MKDILIVDDEKTFLDTLAEGLGFYSRYFHVITADNGRTAIEILKAFMIDVVVTDLKMPGADGYELVDYIKKYYPTIPIIIMTAHGDPAAEKRLWGMGIAQYLEKPLELGEIVSEILSAEKKHRPPDACTLLKIPDTRQEA
jgi:DNA-binding NtrC family response regulator